MSDKLYIVMPAYNEESTIEGVARSWHEIVSQVSCNSKLLIVNDGSKDRTLKILTDLQNELSQLQVLTKDNGGHGSALFFGYDFALDHQADYIFQTDSDGQTVPQEFWKFWNSRKQYDFQIGYRRHRQDGIQRIIVTKVLKLVIWLFWGVWIKDANTPFRLMSAPTLKEHLKLVPRNYNLTNVLLAVLYQKSGQRGRFIQITFLPRQGGVNSINLKRIFHIGIKAVKDFYSLSRSIRIIK